MERNSRTCDRRSTIKIAIGGNAIDSYRDRIVLSSEQIHVAFRAEEREVDLTLAWIEVDIVARLAAVGACKRCCTDIRKDNSGSGLRREISGGRPVKDGEA